MDEIERVSRKAERWKGYMREAPELASGMKIGLALMEAEIKQEKKAVQGDVAEAILALETLRGYSDDD